MATENDYNLLVDKLNELAKTISSVRDEVERRRLAEARERLEPNETDWVNLIGLQLLSVQNIFGDLQAGVKDVLGSEAGVAVFPRNRRLPLTSLLTTELVRRRRAVFAQRAGRG